MKKFSQFLEEKSGLAGFKASDYPAKNKTEILKKFASLDAEDKRIVRNQMMEIFNSMLSDTEGFVKCADFILSNSGNTIMQPMAQGMIDRVDSFFEDPIIKGLGYVDGENQIINSPNPNQNGATNNSYYN
jgi:hypothetical protein